MMDIWTELARFKTTNERPADQVRAILKNGLFSDLETLAIHQQIYKQTYQQTPNTEKEILNTGKPETLNQNQTLNDDDRNTANRTTQRK